MRISFLRNCICAAAIVFVASVFAKTSSSTPPITYFQDKPAVMVTAAQPQFIIKLKSNATTGYSWFLREFNTNILVPVKHEFEAPVNKKLMGAPGFELWTFRARPAAFVVPQQTTIRFVYSRPWDTSENAAQVVFRVSSGASDKAN